MWVRLPTQIQWQSSNWRSNETGKKMSGKAALSEQGARHRQDTSGDLRRPGTSSRPYNAATLQRATLPELAHHPAITSSQVVAEDAAPERLESASGLPKKLHKTARAQRFGASARPFGDRNGQYRHGENGGALYCEAPEIRRIAENAPRRADVSKSIAPFA
jgi:type II secretory pathway component HofQ